MLYAACGAQITAALYDDEVTEICVNADGGIWIELLGKPMQWIGTMPKEHRLQILYLVAKMYNDRVITSEHPHLEAILPGGQRFTGCIPPMSDGPELNIRVPNVRILTREDYVPGTCSDVLWTIMTGSIVRKKNILVIGGMSSGKSTLLNALIAHIPVEERIVTIEDTPELKIALPNVVRRYTSNTWTMADVARMALRTAARRIIPGEIRDGATAVAVLTAWGTGHPGGLCTLHANSAHEALIHLEELCAEVSPGDFRPRIGRTIDLIVALARAHGIPTIQDVLSVARWDAQKEAYVTQSLLENAPDAPHNFDTPE
jgi:type IV secretion system protein VirB11